MTASQFHYEIIPNQAVGMPGQLGHQLALWIEHRLTTYEATTPELLRLGTFDEIREATALSASDDDLGQALKATAAVRIKCWSRRADGLYSRSAFCPYRIFFPGEALPEGNVAPDNAIYMVVDESYSKFRLTWEEPIGFPAD